MNVNFILIGYLLLAVYLILVGISQIILQQFVPSLLLGIIALAAGICILLGHILPNMRKLF